MTAETATTSLVEWSRLQFAVTAAYHYMFVPLTLGLSFIMAVMETLWVKTGNKAWLDATKFWMKLFGVNFAIGIATGLILEFQFGTNWSNYSWFVGDIFGAPLAIEGIVAFFLESTFAAVMFFGWNKVGKRFHLASTWLVFIGANISALWILVANAWMQNPVGMEFNPLTARNEMQDFFAVLLSSTAINKYLHTVTSAYTLSACFVIGISSWFLLKKRHTDFALRSIKTAAVFGLLGMLLTFATGDGSAKDVTVTQPMKLAAMEGLNEGGENVGLTVIGILTEDPSLPTPKMKKTEYAIEIPGMLSFLGYNRTSAYIPGIKNILEGYVGEDGTVFPSVEDRIDDGRVAISALKTYKTALKEGNAHVADSALARFKLNYENFGYGYLDSPYDTIPNVPLVFYSFRIMVGAGCLMMFLFILALWFTIKHKYENAGWLHYTALACIPLAYIASQCGWIVAEVGRQPWVVQNLLPTCVAVTKISSGWVITTFWLFAVLFAVLLAAEIKIMCNCIKKGPEN